MIRRSAGFGACSGSIRVPAMGSKDEKPSGGGFFYSIASGVRSLGTAVHKSVNG